LLITDRDWLERQARDAFPIYRGAVSRTAARCGEARWRRRPRFAGVGRARGGVRRPLLQVVLQRASGGGGRHPSRYRSCWRRERRGL